MVSLDGGRPEMHDAGLDASKRLQGLKWIVFSIKICKWSEKKSKKRKSRKWHKQKESACEKFFSSYDDFKAPIQVSYNEETSMNTIYGGFMSLLLRLAILVFAIQKAMNCYMRTQNTIIETVNYVDFPRTYNLWHQDHTNFHLFSQVLNKDFDNDKNPYVKMKVYIYTN